MSALDSVDMTILTRKAILGPQGIEERFTLFYVLWL